MKLSEIQEVQHLHGKMRDAEQKADALKQGSQLIEIRHVKLHFNEEARQAIHKAAYEYYVAEAARIRAEIEAMGVEL